MRDANEKAVTVAPEEHPELVADRYPIPSTKTEQDQEMSIADNFPFPPLFFYAQMGCSVQLILRLTCRAGGGIATLQWPVKFKLAAPVASTSIVFQ
ncbi:unnamed protein product [Sphacelaria rigidula]